MEKNKIKIHPTAIVDKSTIIGENSEIGAYCIIGESDIEERTHGEKVIIGENAIIGHHSVIYEQVTIGPGVILDPFSRIGPNARIGAETKLLYGTRVHEEVIIGKHCSIAGNCPDRTTFGDYVIHLGRIAHSYYHPFENWDEPEEIGPTLGSNIVVGVDSLIIGSVNIGDNVFIFPREIVRNSLPSDGIFKGGKWQKMPRWSEYLRVIGKISDEMTW